MIPYDIDPSLHAAHPEKLLLDDGFSAPRPISQRQHLAEMEAGASLEEALAGKSEF